MKRLPIILILILAFLGIADSAYLAASESAGTPLLCNIENLSGCNVVATSEYSKVLGIPLADFGVLFYSILFVVAALELALVDRLLRRVLQGLALVGILGSLYFTFVQMFVIKAFCIYCLASALFTLLILVCATFIEPLSGKKSPQSRPPLIPPPPSPPRLTMPPAA